MQISCIGRTLNDMNMQKDISVLIATYKRADILSVTLDSFISLQARDLNWEILVVDNAGDEQTRKTIEDYQKKLPVTYLVETKRGKNSALNHALQKALGKIVVFTDDDIIADPNWLMEIWEGVKRWPECSVFGGKILPKFPMQHHNIPIDASNCIIRGAYAIADWDQDEGVYSPDKIWGANMIIRSEIFKSGFTFNTGVGPNGSDYIPGSEAEFVSRLEKAGYQPVYLPKSFVYHQIRPEQLSTKWLYQRAFKIGRSAAFFRGPTDDITLFGVPKSLVYRTLRAFLDYIYVSLTKNSRTKVYSGLDYWYKRGMAYQYKIGVSPQKEK